VACSYESDIFRVSKDLRIYLIEKEREKVHLISHVTYIIIIMFEMPKCEGL
jgi:hypothetical protein